MERGSPSSNIDQLRDADDGLAAERSVNDLLAGQFEAQVAAHALTNKRNAQNKRERASSLTTKAKSSDYSPPERNQACSMYESVIPAM